MIYLDIVACFETALGTSLARPQRDAVIAGMAARIGGGQCYLPRLPKLIRQQQLAAGTFAEGMPLNQVSAASGIPVRTIKRLRNGK